MLALMAYCRGGGPLRKSLSVPLGVLREHKLSIVAAGFENKGGCSGYEELGQGLAVR